MIQLLKIPTQNNVLLMTYPLNWIVSKIRDFHILKHLKLIEMREKLWFEIRINRKIRNYPHKQRMGKEEKMENQ